MPGRGPVRFHYSAAVPTIPGGSAGGGDPNSFLWAIQTTNPFSLASDGGGDTNYLTTQTSTSGEEYIILWRVEVGSTSDGDEPVVEIRRGSLNLLNTSESNPYAVFFPGENTREGGNQGGMGRNNNGSYQLAGIVRAIGDGVNGFSIHAQPSGVASQTNYWENGKICAIPLSRLTANKHYFFHREDQQNNIAPTTDTDTDYAEVTFNLPNKTKDYVLFWHLGYEADNVANSPFSFRVLRNDVDIYTVKTGSGRGFRIAMESNADIYSWAGHRRLNNLSGSQTFKFIYRVEALGGSAPDLTGAHFVLFDRDAFNRNFTDTDQLARSVTTGTAYDTVADQGGVRTQFNTLILGTTSHQNRADQYIKSRFALDGTAITNSEGGNATSEEPSTTNPPSVDADLQPLFNFMVVTRDNPINQQTVQLQTGSDDGGALQKIQNCQDDGTDGFEGQIAVLEFGP